MVRRCDWHSLRNACSVKSQRSCSVFKGFKSTPVRQMAKTHSFAVTGPCCNISFHKTVIALEDTGKGRSITNDAEGVISELASRLDLSRFRVIYRDTRGVWDELLVKDGQFAGFASINERDLDAALAKIAE